MKKQQIAIIRKPTRPQMPSLTTKFEGAIIIYARAKAEKDGMVNSTTLARAAVAAYRMGYEDLYYWMAKNRYKWDSRAGAWRDLRRVG